jgi:hypothetical protein
MVQQRAHIETAVQIEEVADNLSPESREQQMRLQQAEMASNINKWLGSKICGKAC